MADPVVQNIQNTTSNLPEYAKPYFENLLQRGQANSYQDYTPYPNQRIAEFTPGQTYAQQQAYDLKRPDQFGAASSMATTAGLGSLNAGMYNPSTFSFGKISPGAPQAAPQMTGAQMGDHQMGPAQTFDKAQADKYMSPYMQSVVNATKREAITDAQKTQLMNNLGAARQGTYGGARQLLAGTERERALGMNLSDIQTKGLQAAFENAQQQFERDRNAGFNVNKANLDYRMQAGMANLTADQQTRVQNLASQLQTQGLNAEQAFKYAMANLESERSAAQLGEQSKQFGTSSGLQALAQALQSSQTLGTLGAQQQQTDLQRIQAQAAAGAEQQAHEQKYLDIDYADFLRQRDYPTEQLNYYSSLLRGLPITPNSTATTYAPPPSMLSQVGGLGLGALSLYNLSK